MRTVAVLALDGVIPADLSTPVAVFGHARLPDGRAAYRIRVCGNATEVEAGAFAVRLRWGLDVLETADTIVLPGCADPLAQIPDEVLAALREAAARGARLVSICTGAFILAATGLLDGLRATTHWLAADLLAQTYPNVEVDPQVLYIDNGQLLSSAGASAGLDLCLHLVRRDHGSAVAADSARLAVVPLEREGGQAQFIVADRPPAPRGGELEPVLRWMEENAELDLSVEDIAVRAGMSTRTLNRRFREQVGSAPMRWLSRARVRHAQHLLEFTDHPVEQVGAHVGFGSPTAFRERFKRVVGVSPNAYRTLFHAQAPGDIG